MALLALASNAVHKLWKWQRSERNQLGKVHFLSKQITSYMFMVFLMAYLLEILQATAYVVPQLWQPPSGTLMSNDVNENKPSDESSACIALSKNDSYVMSASGGKVSLFNMMTFKVCYCCFCLFCLFSN